METECLGKIDNEQKHEGLIVVISGPSGVGKDTVIGYLERDFGFQKIVSFTTRPPRTGEKDGVNYNFISLNDFLTLKDRGELFDHAIVTGDHYGLPAKTVAEQFFLGKRVALNVVVETARLIKAQYSSATLVFIKATDMQCLIERLKKRGMTIEDIAERYRENPRQFIPPEDFDLVITNCDSEQKVVAETIACYLQIKK